MKKYIILDLDNTLICNETARPYLKDFLLFLFNNFEKVNIWTSASLEWLENAFKNILQYDTPKDKKFYFLGYRDHCTFSYVISNGHMVTDKCYKELKLVYSNFPEFNETNTVIVDDREMMFSLNINNGILIDPFTENKPFDIELYRLTLFLKNEILPCDDVRKIDKINWKNRYRNF